MELLLNLSKEQKSIIQTEVSNITAALVQMNFNEPEKDELRLRQHAFLKGKLDTILGILQHDARVVEANQAEAKRLQEEAATRQAANSEE